MHPAVFVKGAKRQRLDKSVLSSPGRLNEAIGPFEICISISKTPT